MAASAQVMISTPNFHRPEIAYPELPYYAAALPQPLDVRDGLHRKQDSPGIGNELAPVYLTAGPNQPLIHLRHFRESRKQTEEGRKGRANAPFAQ